MVSAFINKALGGIHEGIYDMIEKVGIIGAGQMGTGIAYVFATAGFDTRILDVKPEIVEKSIASIGKKLDRQIAKGAITAQDRDEVLARVSGASEYADLADCDLALETASENEEVKRAILQQLSGVLKADAIIATNTSSISVTRLAANTDRPGKFMGMHFMNPAPVMKLVELVRGLATDEATFQVVLDLTVKLDKTPVNAEDFPAFMVNRVLMPMINEAIYTLYEGVGSVESIDVAMKLGANHPMGPLELADFIGLDTCLSVMQVLYEGLSDTKYRPCPLLVKYVEAGWLGRKAQRGFYDYTGDKPIPTR